MKYLKKLIDHNAYEAFINSSTLQKYKRKKGYNRLL